MGLLDEAIRDHLELKRRSGADPGVVAREEHEALAPGPPADGYTPRFASNPALAQETAELDMQSEMDGSGEIDSDGLEPATHAGDTPVLGSFDVGEIPDEEARGRLPEMIPGQERLSLE